MAGVSDWIERWQPLLAASLTFISACIFAVTATRLADSYLRMVSQAARRATKSQQDLRQIEPFLLPDEEEIAPPDIIQTLEQIRSVVRSALSTLTSNDDAAAGFFATSYTACLRLTELTLEGSSLPPNAPQAAFRHLEALNQHIAAIRFLSRDMTASEISDILIKVHSTARHLARTLHLRVESAPPAIENDRSSAAGGQSSAS